MNETSPAPRFVNRLAHETSPYLLQHAHNPVDWYPWSAEAQDRARAEDKPILLSVGYSACHWCHVMERESFENPAIAALMNESFVCIKVDREERPDLDQIYMGAVQAMTGQGGWPMTVFLTPDGKPFYGGTYYPPEDRYGRPGFPSVLSAVAAAWQQRRPQIEAQGTELVEALRQAGRVEPSQGDLTPALLDQAYETLRAHFDGRLGGFGSAPKFPPPMLLDFLLRFAHRKGGGAEAADALGMVTLTLDKMAQGGIYDQLGGGFARYSTDDYWLVPHFEKMLYDNAQLAHTYLRAYQTTHDPYYRRIVEETLDYVRREMTAPDGGFYSSQDADSEGEEGKFFVWTPEEVKAVLGAEDAALFARCYDVTPRGNWEGANILNLSAPADAFARSLGIAPEAFQERLDRLRSALFAAREQRVRPGRDEKVVAAWNGLMLAAFADAGAVLGRADYVQTAVNNAAFVLERLLVDGRLRRTGKAVAQDTPEGMAHPPLESSAFRAAPIDGFLEDYAFYADGLLHLYEATGGGRWLAAAQALAATMQALFADPDGGFYDTAEDAERLFDRPKDTMDNATPAGGTVAAEVLLRLSALTGDESLRRAAGHALHRMSAAMGQYPQAFGRLLSVADFYLGAVRELVVIGGTEEAGTARLLAVARETYQPNLVIARHDPNDTEAVLPPLFKGRRLLDGQPTAYLCENFTCQLPTTDPAVLREQLATR